MRPGHKKMIKKAAFSGEINNTFTKVYCHDAQMAWFRMLLTSLPVNIGYTFGVI